jgi:hypothetical protein
VERVHRTINSLLTKVISDNQVTWQERLVCVTASCNGPFHEVIGYSPYYIMYGKEYRTPLDLAMGVGNAFYGNTTIDYVDQLQQHLKQAYADV